MDICLQGTVVSISKYGCMGKLQFWVAIIVIGPHNNYKWEIVYSVTQWNSFLGRRNKQQHQLFLTFTLLSVYHTNVKMSPINNIFSSIFRLSTNKYISSCIMTVTCHLFLLINFRKKIWSDFSIVLVECAEINVPNYKKKTQNE